MCGLEIVSRQNVRTVQYETAMNEGSNGAEAGSTKHRTWASLSEFATPETLIGTAISLSVNHDEATHTCAGVHFDRTE